MRLLLIALGLTLFLNSTAQKAPTPLEALGKGLNSVEVSNFTSSFNHDKRVESFLAFLKTYKLDYLEDGVTLEYDAQMSLYKIVMFDSGYSYGRYQNELPFKLRWGQTLEEIEKEHSFLDEVSDNPYKRRQTNENYTLDYYFTSGRLSSLKITASNDLLKKELNTTFKAWGFRLLPDGLAVDGDVMSGSGTMTWGDNAAIYKGEWSYGLPHGKGEYSDTFGNKYNGEFKLGFFWGEGQFYSKQQNLSYTGAYVMGKRHGKGKISYSSKVGYVGDWFQDEMRGQGVYLMGTDYYYQGEMFNNNINGKGTLHTPDGRVSGTFKNGKPHGYCEQSTKDGLQSLNGNWRNGKKEGKFLLISGETETVKYYKNDIEVLHDTD
jgi:hypothetical protein